MLPFTSMGAKVDYALLRGGGSPYTFRIHGQNDHSIGSLLPGERRQPKFSQLYIYDAEHGTRNRIATLSSLHTDSGVNELLLKE